MSNLNEHHIFHPGKDGKYEVIVSKRSGLIPVGSKVITLTDDGFLRMKVGYFFKNEYHYYLQDATIQKEESYLFAHRVTLDLKTDDSRHPLQLPLFSGRTLMEKLHASMDDAPHLPRRQGENIHGLNPKRKLIDRILCWLIVLIVFFGIVAGISLLNKNNEDKQTASAGVQQEDASRTLETAEAPSVSGAKENPPAAEENASPGEEAASPEEEKTSAERTQKVDEILGKVLTDIEQIDRESIWNSVMPHIKATSDLALTVAFIVIILVFIGLFLPAKACRFVSLGSVLACIGVSVYIAYTQVDFGEPEVLKRVLFAIAPLLVALIVSIVFYIAGRSATSRGYHLIPRIGFLVAFLLSAASLWVFAYGYLNGEGFELPSIYPDKILQLGENAYAYVAGGTILAMLLVSSILSAAKSAGSFGSLCSLAIAGHFCYIAVSGRSLRKPEDIADIPQNYLIPIGVFIVVWFICLVVKGSGRRRQSM